MVNLRGKLLLLLLLFLGVTSSYAQKVFINGKEGNRLLQWTDFKGKPDDNSPFFAYTAWKTNVKFSSVKFEGEKALIEGFEMTVEFDENKSWVKKGKETDELLKHEQGHFDVGLLYMRDVLSTLPSLRFTRANFKEEFRLFIEGIHKRYAEMGKQYDKETSHSILKEEQGKWNAFFDKELQR